MAVDANYPNVALLLHGNGVNGSEGPHAIIDSSHTPKKPLQINGSGAGISISTDKAAAFGGTSIKFVMSGLLYPHSAGLAPTGDFAVDARFWVPAVTYAVERVICSKASGSGNATYRLSITPTGEIYASSTNAAANATLSITSTDKVSASAPNRVEFGRVGNTFYLFLNGVLQGTQTRSEANYVNIYDPLAIAQYSNSSRPLFDNGAAYIEEFRVTSAARHTANYTVETEPFPNAAFVVSGNVKDFAGANAARRVVAHRESDGYFSGEAMSDGVTGNYSIPLSGVATASAHTVTAYPAAGEDLPALTLRGVVPV